MEIIGCGKGHYYNPELYSSCPECAKENGGADFLGATEPVNFNNYANSFGDIGATEPVNFNGFANSVSDFDATEPANPNFAKPANNGFSPAANHSFNNPMSTTDFRGDFSTNSNTGGSKVQDYAPTMIDPSISAPPATHGVPFMPVVGWLVCIDGAAKGRDYRVHSQYNYIGRANHMDICISGDDYISAERAAVIAYDAEEKIFSFGPGLGHNIVRVNGKMLMNATVLNPYDELTIGKTRLMFVPLCGERFDWNDK